LTVVIAAADEEGAATEEACNDDDDEPDEGADTMDEDEDEDTGTLKDVLALSEEAACGPSMSSRSSTINKSPLAQQG
jgi:hypothetical protein